MIKLQLFFVEHDMGVKSLAKVCAICGKEVATGNRVSHSNIKTRRVWFPNVQKVRVIINGRPTKTYVCTRCLRSGKVQRAV